MSELNLASLARRIAAIEQASQVKVNAAINERRSEAAVINEAVASVTNVTAGQFNQTRDDMAALEGRIRALEQPEI